ncbi:hypothetical protein [Sporosarcina sp. FSL K6-5500]|uniref:hypothetical protein n=1 Tax=Sporosarcina sp. FSL K6-5500 TaxID=2921558 RepID=UPI0030FBFA35
MKHEDDISDNTQESFLEAQEKAHGWLGNEKIDKKYSAKNYIHNPYLDHAAGDYEPLKEDSRFHNSEDPHRTTGKFNKERGFSQKKRDALIAKNGQLGDMQTIFSTLNHDRH